MSIRTKYQIIANKSGNHALHDTNTIAKNVGFIPDATGDFPGRLRNDTADTTFYVAAGQFYAGDIQLAKSTGATGTANLTIFYWEY